MLNTPNPKFFSPIILKNHIKTESKNLNVDMNAIKFATIFVSIVAAIIAPLNLVNFF
jgi:hypothetical protein